MDPPQCVQNAMMTKDKKPFTYTPGGIDLSEVRSPRMQRRIERNANLGNESDMAPQAPRPQNVGPLPPAAMAAMRPQTQVQVFPSPPPPPPMSKNIPPPPPPPTCPLPTQKVTTTENQVLERPDMTKIIPDNPMAMLRRTGGPAPRKSFVEQMYEEQKSAPPNPPSPPQRAHEAQSPRYPPPVTEKSAPMSPPVQQQRQPQPYQPPQQQYQPPTPPQDQYQPSRQLQYQPSQPAQPQYQPAQYQPTQPSQPQYQPSYQPPIIERQPSFGKQDQPQRKNVSSSVGSLYIPPLSQQQPVHQQKFVSPPSPPEREPQIQSPGTPTLKEAPKPWQQKNVQQQQAVPPWVKRDDEERIQAPQPSQPAPSQRWQQPASPQQPAPQVKQPPSQQFSPRSPAVQQQSPRTPPTQNQSYPSNSVPARIEVRPAPYPQDPEPDTGVERVYITQPIVLQHPGPRAAPPKQGQPKQPQQQQQQPSQNSYQQPRQQVQQKPKVDSSGARIIPIQVERTPPSTPGADRGLTRQLSWGSQPSQSNSFKVIQKMTRTDEDDDDDTPVTQHSPRYPQEMPEQVRRMKINDNGHFKQGNGQPQPYVHPSEQVVPEPKKYMGSNIPSRSFKILQAMTAPSDGCASANYNEEVPYNPMYNPYNYPYYPPSYWPDYYPNYYPPEQPEPPRPSEKSFAKSGRSTPVPNAAQYTPSYWNDYYSNFYPQQQSDSSSKMSDKSSSTKSGRSTPLPSAVPAPVVPPPYWGYGPSTIPASNYHVRSQSTPLKPENTRRPQTPKPHEYHSNYTDESVHYPPYHMYPPYYDPYYYSYYYGYPPMMPPYPYYSSTTDNEEYGGYSSQDEMASYNNTRKPTLKRRNSLDNSANSVQSLRQHFEVRSKSATPKITITPSFSQEKLGYNGTVYKSKENREFEIDLEDEEELYRGGNLQRLQSVKSIPNIHNYTTECSDTESSESEESTETETEEEEEIPAAHNGEEILPHQLSVIYEESERGDSRRSFRPSSVTSEATTIGGHHSEDDDIEDFLAAQNVKFKINVFQEATEQISVKMSNGNSVKTIEQETESSTNLSIRNHNSLLSENQSDQSKYVVKKYVNNIKTVQENRSDDRNREGKRECDNKVTNIQFIEKEHLNSSFTTKEDQDISVKETATTVIRKKDKESDKNSWGVVDNKNNVKETSEEISIKNEVNECDKINLKAEHVMMHEDECKVVSVKLRNKRNAVKEISNFKTEDIITPAANNESKISDDLFFKTDGEYNKNTVYDILKDEDTDEIESGGTLMKVGSFVSALEAIKRNSGLWNLEETDLSNPPTIKEETECEGSNKACVEVNDNMQSETNALNDNSNNGFEEEPDVDEKATNHSDESEVDFWSQIKNDDDDFIPRRRSQYFEEEDEEKEEDEEEENICHTHAGSANNSNPTETRENDSASSRHSSFSKSQVITGVKSSNQNSEANEYSKSSQENCNKSNQNYTQTYTENNNTSEETSDTDSSEEEQDDQQAKVDEKQTRNSNSRSKSLEPQTIKERIEALRQSIAQKQKLLQEKEEIPVSVKNKISAIEVSTESRSKTTSTKSSVKSFEEYSEEEEGDSGVISDISRHISDNEEFPELKKLTRYERAATHSRLFKLLQDECDIEEEEEEDEVFVQQEDKFSKLSVRQNQVPNKLTPSRSKLSLALDKYNENSNGQEVNEKLVEELLQSLLRSRKAQVFKNMPKEKLRAAAIIILQEGIEGCETPSEEFSGILSPLRGETQSSTPAETPQEFYADNSEYKQYYDSWSEAPTEIGPSKALKLLQEHLGATKLGTIEGILAKYPKILSNKNISKEILKHLDDLSSDCSSPYSQNVPQSNDVTNT